LPQEKLWLTINHYSDSLRRAIQVYADFGQSPSQPGDNREGNLSVPRPKRAWLKALHGPGESHSEVIIRVARGWRAPQVT
jgi:hypothetical protein